MHHHVWLSIFYYIHVYVCEHLGAIALVDVRGQFEVIVLSFHLVDPRD